MTDRTANSIQKIAYHVIFTGRVQGVGFRFTAQRFALELGLTGWVRNLPDEGVELCAEGDAVFCQRLVERLKEHFTIYDVKASEGPVSGHLSSFEIRY